jgi:Type I phosphodiesterase / nucleotide pyrophosphatase
VVELSSHRSLAVLAVDGLGYHVAAAGLAPDVLAPLTTSFPSTTTTALLSSLTGSTPSEHGVIGVQYLHSDGRRGYNAVTGEVTEPGGAGAGLAAGPGVSPDPAVRTVFMALRDLGVAAFCLPGELAAVPAAWRDRAFAGSRVLDGRGRAAAPAGEPGIAGVHGIVDAVTRDLTDTLDRYPGSLVWAYLNLDDHLHRHGPDQDIELACAAVNSLARRLSTQGTAVVLYADHGCVASRPSAETMAVWDEVTSPRACRLPAGGAGRVRWLYPHAGGARRLADELRSRLPGVVVSSPEELSRWGVVEPGSIGYARLGEVVLLALGPDFPVPDPALAYEHGSLTAEEILVPLAVWQPVR